jgi:hypothetical protein
MALQRSSEYFKERAVLLDYCRENNLCRPIQQCPFIWPSREQRLASPEPDFIDVFPSFADPLEESLSALGAHLDEYLILQVSDEDVYDIRRTSHLRLEMPLLHNFRAGSQTLRKFGPDSLKKCSASLPKEAIHDNDGGMDIPKDNDETVQVFEKDKKITVNVEAASYLRDNIHRYTREQCEDVILCKASSYKQLTTAYEERDYIVTSVDTVRSI